MTRAIANCSLALAATLATLAALPGQNVGLALTNGIDGYVEIPYDPALVPATGITLEAWITYDDSTLPAGWRYPTVVRQNITPQQEAYFLRIEAGNSGQRTLRWKVVTQGNGAAVCDWSFTPGQLLTWTHVAATYDGNTAALYIDGNQVSTAPANGQPLWDRGGELRIGKGDDSGGPIEVWNGEIDEVRLWPFARSAAEIQHDKDFALALVPGAVSTWNLDGHTLDTSNNLFGSAIGAANFLNNSLVLPFLPLASGVEVGTGTAGCGPFHITFGSLPQAGNLDFQPVCTGAPPNAPTFLAIAFQTAATPLAIAGIEFWLDQGSSVLVLSTTDGAGVSRHPAPLPAWLPVGQQLAFQYGFVDGCGSQGVTASAALETLCQ
ncbi:MAG: LamG domain-containing protein [bacterium]|nr:LamG domain-containing protein [bacterium]